MPKSLQETYAAKSICYGCGPANSKGLRIRSMAGEGNFAMARWKPEAFHEAFPGMLNGGIIGSLLDCHSNWTAAYTLMREQGLKEPPCTVTADYHVKLMRPTPSDSDVTLEAKAVEIKGDRVVIEAVLYSEKLGKEKPCATCRGTFVAVKEGHPAFHRW